MIVIVRNKKGISVKRYRIFGLLCVLINKIKGNEVYILNGKDI